MRLSGLKIEREALFVVLGTQALIDAVLTMRAVVNGYPPKWWHIPAEVLAYAVLCAAAYLMFLAIEAGGRRFGLAGRIAAALVSAFIAALVHVPILMLVFRHMTDYPQRAWEEIWSLSYIYAVAMPFLFTGAALVAYSFWRDVQARERQLAETQRLAQEAQLVALRYQINPHFLFNTLNAISALVLDHRNAAAETMLLRLSAFFRLTLTLEPTEAIVLSREIELQRTYLDIEQARFTDALDVAVDLPPALENALVPALILQPLVENAVKYGLDGEAGRARIAIAARAEGEVLVLEVTNTVLRTNAPGAGIGLRNVAERLAAEYGDEANMSVDDSVAGRFHVALTLPLRLAPPRLEARRPAIAAVA
ncbi:sensor histidine kinase [Caulobacter sp. NIBR2454]|uniref:sensor histidine kinase n=1 Tax=Caulobacter sp. NIBR2454 TaxID=3015996 RepID=UPI0022B74A6B|nr:histidine kinase [Caulobacter sp. NIBR2454]